MKRIGWSNLLVWFGIAILLKSGCGKAPEQKDTEFGVENPPITRLYDGSACLSDNPIETQNCWAYATVRMFQARGQNCTIGYKQAIYSMSSSCIALDWNGTWGNQSQETAFFNSVAVGDAISLGGQNTHIVYVVGKSGSTLSAITVDDANRFGSGQIVHNTTLQQIKDANSSYVPTHLWKYTGPGGAACPLKPDAPVLVSPANGLTNQPLGEFAFDWTDPWSPTSIQNYKFQISTTSNFTSVVIEETPTVSTIAYIEFPTGATTYYWRVNATNTGATSDWSAYRTISTAPVLTAITMPASGSIYEANLDLEMQWDVNVPLSNTVRVYYSSNGGSSWTWKADAAYSAGENGNTYMLAHPGVVSTTAKMKIEDYNQPSYSVTSATFITGPAVSISGPTSRYNGQSGTWSVSATPSGSYTYSWYRANYSTGMNNYSYVGSGSGYTGAPSGSSFNLKVETFLNSIKVGTGYTSVTCSNCGGIDP